MLRFLLGISFCITLSACQTETLVKDVNISKKQELHNMNMNTYFAKNTKKLDEVIQIPSEGVKSIDVYALYGFVESFSPISTAEQIKQRVGEGLGYKDLFGTKSVHYRLEPKDFSHFFFVCYNVCIIGNNNINAFRSYNSDCSTSFSFIQSRWVF